MKLYKKSLLKFSQKVPFRPGSLGIELGMLVEMENMLKKEDMNVMFTDRFIFTQRSRISTQLEEFKKGNLIWLGWVAASLKRKGTATS